MKGEAKSICLPNDYVKFELPPVQPITISIGVDIKDIPKVSDKDFAITLNAYFIVKWHDSRLIVQDLPNHINTTDPQSDLSALNLAILKTLWLPDVEIRNLKSFETHLILSKLEGFWVDGDNNLLHAVASRITFICPMSFNSFPMDVQVCVFQVGSFNYATNKLLFRDEFLPVKEEAIRSILDYDINIYPLNPEDTSYTALNMNYSVAGFQLVLTRKASFYVVTYYLPSGLFVVVSWISFLINPEVIPGRMTLLITVFLVLINIFNTIQTNSPKADGLTAIEGWLIACIVFVFAALVEYTGILLKMKMRKLTGIKRKKDNYAITDLAFFVFFPILFTIFNVLYWSSICWNRMEEQNKWNT